jgi:hypothetical protein
MATQMTGGDTLQHIGVQTWFSNGFGECCHQDASAQVHLLL